MITSPTISTPGAIRLESLLTSIDGFDFLRNIGGSPSSSVARVPGTLAAALRIEKVQLAVEFAYPFVEVGDLLLERDTRRLLEHEFRAQAREFVAEQRVLLL